MTEQEICHKVRVNGGNSHYLGILADLNLCSVRDIEKILRQNNFVYSKKTGYVPAETINKKQVKTEMKGDVNMKKLSKEEKAELKEKIVQDYLKTGATYSVLATKYNCSTWFIGKAVKSAVSITEQPKTEKTGKGSFSKNLMKAIENDQKQKTNQVMEDFLNDLDVSVIEGAYRMVCLNLFTKEKELADMKALKDILEKLYNLKTGF